MEISILNTKVHNRNNFSCEEDSLTNYIKQQASQDMKKRLAVCFVLTENNSTNIKGYYTLTNDSIDREEVPDKYQKRIPSGYNLPVTLLGRLARDISMKGKGAGEFLLIHALKRCYGISKKEIGSMAVVVDPINEKAIRFYQKYGFIFLPDSGKMFLPMSTIAKLFE